MIIEGKNPVAEALSAGKTIEKLYVVKGNFEATVNRIVQMAKAAKVPTISSFSFRLFRIFAYR